ncbi:GIY-YIG nuclease family protein [Paraferrimonas sp. SM1919]|uniref:GIY-YIG nuclease family protein n=1 Tax=Paraferrimonas sp. SM1919 TaxID=2662263 RepID=UPI0013D47C15|nr:GIY-YIG nuclease family protein [Paraferrimonas sp. SM1919]
MGKIYVAWDTTKPDLAKVGMTTRDAFVRVAETENPDYVLFTDFDVDNEHIEQTERDIHSFLERYFSRRHHKSYGGVSEWFEGTPKEVAEKCGEFLKHGTSARELRITIADLEKELSAANEEKDKVLKEHERLKDQYSTLETKFEALKQILKELSDFDGTSSLQNSVAEPKTTNKLSKKSVKNALEVLRGNK